MDVYLLASALDRHRTLLDAAAPPDVRWLALRQDGTVQVDGTDQVLDPRDATPEIAWMTSDVVNGGPARPFFGLVTRSQSLRWLQSSAAGFDHPMFGDLVRRGVRLTASHIAGPPIADFVLRAALDHLQRADLWRAAADERRWEVHEFVEMASTRWLVIGFGSIGQEIAVRARAFGAHVTGVRRSPATGDEPADALVHPDSVPDLLGESHVVVLAVPSSGSTDGMVDAAFLAAMRPDALLVNIGRGSLVDEAALIAALDAGQLAAAALDVTATEPLPADDPLWAHPKVTITPHGSANGDGRFARAAALFADNLGRYVRGEPLLHEVSEADLA